MIAMSKFQFDQVHNGQRPEGKSLQFSRGRVQENTFFL